MPGAGCRGLVRGSAAADVIGEIIEDNAAVSRTGGGGHQWAPVHRWAVAVDDGRLVFADTEVLTIDPSSTTPSRTQTAMCPLLGAGPDFTLAG
ncbi:hypothetical protein [Rhodococcus koreensis]|uniref:hypothetical protein n=1 Tax=Rhodococcus koreensis TaxID=99653 RepID=UPI003B84AD20